MGAAPVVLIRIRHALLLLALALPCVGTSAAAAEEALHAAKETPSLSESLPVDFPRDWNRYAMVATVDIPGSAPVYAIATTENDLLDTVYFISDKRTLLKKTFKDDRLGPDGQVKRFYSTNLAGGGAIVDVDVYSGEA
jgi:hypothetical protein